jgi:DNA-binding NarL/FixJ family response regulator
MSAIKTLIVDDNADFRRRVKEFLVLETDIAIVGEAADGREAVRKAKQLEPDLVLMDMRMPGMNGMDATRQLKLEMPQVQVILMSVNDLEQYRNTAVASGASGYVSKRSLVSALLPAIRALYLEQKQRGVVSV